MTTIDAPFLFIGNNVAVDLVNTEMLSRGERVELLQGVDDLAHWARAAGLQVDGQLQAGDLVAARALRAALRNVFQARIDGAAGGRRDLAVINEHLAEYALHKVLQAGKNRPDYEWAPAQDAGSARALLSRLAYAGADLLTSPQADRLKRCTNAECVLIFVDTSRSQRRRWCSMEVCGNRAKVAKHYHNHRPG